MNLWQSVFILVLEEFFAAQIHAAGIKAVQWLKTI